MTVSTSPDTVLDSLSTGAVFARPQILSASNMLTTVTADRMKSGLYKMRPGISRDDRIAFVCDEIVLFMTVICVMTMLKQNGG